VLKKMFLSKFLRVMLAIVVVGSAFPRMNVEVAQAADAPKYLSFMYDNFVGASNRLLLNGSARVTDNAGNSSGTDRIRLTPNSGNKWGTAFNKDKISLKNNASFSTYFVTQIYSTGQTADGIVFTVQTNSNQAGSSGGGLGYQGITNSIGIEFDTYQNTSDPSYKHVAIVKNGSVNHSSANSVGTDISANGAWSYANDRDYYVWVDYDGLNKKLEVRMSLNTTRPSSAILSKTIDIRALLGQDDVYAGFTASTGGSYAEHDVLKWHFLNDYQPIDVKNNTYVQAPTSYTLTPTYQPDGTIKLDITAVGGTSVSNVPLQISATNNVTKMTSGTVLSDSSLSTNASGKATVTLSQVQPNTTVRVTGPAGIYKDIVINNPKIASVTPIEAIGVDAKTSLADAKKALPKSATIIDSYGMSHSAPLTWNIAGYDGSVSADYTATGTFTLPTGVQQSNPTTTLSVSTTVTVRDALNNADLSNLIVTNVTLSPTFNKGVTSYNMKVASTVQSVQVIPTLDNRKASVTVKNQLTSSGDKSSVIPLSAGINEIPVVVTAQDGTTIKEYLITITREGSTNADLITLSSNLGSLSPTFQSKTKEYTLVVEPDTAEVELTATTSDVGAQIKINSSEYTGPNHKVSVSAGDWITVDVTAENGIAKKQYRIKVLYRNVISFMYNNFSTDTNLLQINGNASVVSNELVLTPAATNKSGSVFYKKRTSLANKRSFSTFFGFKMEGQAGIGQADGITFTVQTVANTAGTSGGGIGYAGLNPSFAVEFDTWQNSEFGDPAGPHIGVDLNGSVRSVATALTAPLNIRDGGQYYSWIDYDGANKTIEVRLSSTEVRPVTASLIKTGIDLSNVLNMDEVFVGFTSGTGGAAQKHTIQKWYFNNDYNPIDLDEYVYTELPTSVALTATGDLTSEVALAAEVRNKNGQLVGAGVPVTFSSTRGTLSQTIVDTDASGIARTTLTASVSSGSAEVRAVARGGAYAVTQLANLKLSDEQSVQADADSLQITYKAGDSASSVSQNVGLKTSGTNGTSIVWTTDYAEGVTTGGAVTRPDYLTGDVQVILTATITKGIATTTKTFTLIVKRNAYVAPTLTVGSTQLVESTNDDGSIVGQQVITVAGGTFAADIMASDLIVNNLPAGLGYSIVRDSATQLTISFTGNATNHRSEFSTSQASITIPSHSIVGTIGDITTAPFGIEFKNPAATLTVSGAVYEEYPYDSGAIIGPLVVEIVDGQFVDPIDPSKIIVNNLPTGFGIDVDRVSNTKLNIDFTGFASSHSNNDDVSNASVTIKSGLIVGGGPDIQSPTFKINFNEPEPYLEVISNTLKESNTHDGSVTGSFIVNLLYGKYNGTIDASHLNIVNLPPGLSIGSVSTVTESVYSLEITLTGNATNLSVSGSVYGNLQLDLDKDKVIPIATQFDNPGVPIDLLEPVSSNAFTLVFTPAAITVPGSTIITDNNTDGSITQKLTVNLTNGVFDSDMSSGVMVNNLPEGLGITVNRISDTQLEISFTGKALLQNSASMNASVTLSPGKVVGATGALTTNNFEIDALSNQTLVSQDASNIEIVYQSGDDIDNVTGNVGLPLLGDNGSTISWSSDVPGVITSGGVVSRPSYTVGDTTVTLTATITKDGVSDTKNYELTVKALPISNAESAALDKNLIEIGYKEGDDKDTVKGDLGLVFVGDHGSTITWSSVPSGFIDGTTGKVTRPADGNQVVTLTATIQNGSSIETISFTLTILQGGLEDAIDLANQAIVNAEAAKSAFTTAGGDNTAQQYVDVDAAIEALNTALDATPQVQANIAARTADLNAAVAAIVAKTAGLELEKAAAIANTAAETAKSVYEMIGGGVTDTVYVDVVNAKTALDAALSVSPLDIGDVEEAIADLNTAVAALVSASAEALLAITVTAATLSDTTAQSAKALYIAVEGSSTDGEYVAVDEAQTALGEALTSIPQVQADIEAATAVLNIAIAHLLDQAAELAKAAYTTAGGDEVDAPYTAVEQAQAALAAALTATPQDQSAIQAANSSLYAAVEELTIATRILSMTTMEQAKALLYDITNSSLTDEQKKAYTEAVINKVLDPDSEIKLLEIDDLDVLVEAIEQRTDYASDVEQQKLILLAEKAIADLARTDAPTTEGGVDFQNANNNAIMDFIDSGSITDTADQNILRDKLYAEVAARSLTRELAFTFDLADTWESITEQFITLEQGLYDTTISWTSSKEVIDATSNPAAVTRQDADTSVIMTATIMSGTQFQTKTFLLIVKSSKFGNKVVEGTQREVSVVQGNGAPSTPTAIQRINLMDNDTNTEIVNKIDKVIVDSSLVPGAVGQVLTVYIPDNSADIADEIAIEIPRSTLLNLGNDLVINTDQGSVTLSKASIEQIQNDGQELYFRIVPIRDQSLKQQVVTEMNSDANVRAATVNKTVHLLDIPREIDTNYTGYRTTIVLPLTNITIPTTNEVAFLDSLRIFIQHSDGETKVVPGTIVRDGANNPVGISFEIEKFSTFSIIQLRDIVYDDSTVVVIPEAVKQPVELNPDEEGHHTRYMSGYEDGTFRPDRNITRAEMAAALSRNLGYVASKQAVVSSYPDVKSTHWALGVIEFIKTSGLMVGDSDGNFRPDAPITRAEMAVIASKRTKLNPANFKKSIFTDVQNHWALGFIESGRQSRVLSGYQDGTYRPNNKLSRAEAVVVINRMFERGPLLGLSTSTWADVSTSHWAFTNIEEASQDHFFTRKPDSGEYIAATIEATE
jgi:tetratricopeptide (TPR) repeat protein